jgi:hypothetical protein
MPIPKPLVDLAERVRHPAVTQTGITRTADGRWALLVEVKKGTPLPLKDLERDSAGYAIVYEEEPDTIPVARPAYPKHGE